VPSHSVLHPWSITLLRMVGSGLATRTLMMRFSDFVPTARGG
jgi:hypothetical protein